MKLFSVTLMTALFATAFASQAKADGFVCESDDGFVVKIYNHTNPEVGTRNAAVMILSDSLVGAGRKTIARFQEVNGVLSNRASSYEAKVDLRFNDSKRKGELIMGTKLGELASILVDLDFTYAAPVAAGEEVDGTITLVKRNGERLGADLSCARYLKGE